MLVFLRCRQSFSAFRKCTPLVKYVLTAVILILCDCETIVNYFYCTAFSIVSVLFYFGEMVECVRHREQSTKSESTRHLFIDNRLITRTANAPRGRKWFGPPLTVVLLLESAGSRYRRSPWQVAVG